MFQDLAHHLRFIDGGINLPAEDSHDLVADCETRISAFDYFADGKGAHRVSDLNPGPIRALVGNPSAHRGIDREIFVVNDKLSVATGRQRRGADREVFRTWYPVGPRAKPNLLIHRGSRP